MITDQDTGEIFHNGKWQDSKACRCRSAEECDCDQDDEQEDEECNQTQSSQ